MSDPHRPIYHVTPPSGWMNDPCGLVFHDGEWHLFFQYNPTTAVWGNIHWGHAVSRDLIRWTHLGVALKPDPALGMVFTGSVVLDSANSSGLCAAGSGCLVAAFTHAQGKEGKEQQSIAHSVDNGRTWKLFSGNPVIPNPGTKDFRDPRIFLHVQSSKWVMVLAQGDRAPIYISSDLKSWTHVSTFGPLAGLAKGSVWECPELFDLVPAGEKEGRRWVLKVDLNLGIGKPGSHGRYFVGSFDGETFKVEGPDEGARLDGGEDFYAAQLFSGARGRRRLWTGWMSSWQYGLQTPTTSWRGVMSIPRELSLIREDDVWILCQAPAPEVAGLRADCAALVDAEPGMVAGESRALEGVEGGSLEISATLKLTGAAEVRVRLFADGAGVETIVGYDGAKGVLFLDRRRSGETDFHPGFPARHTAPLKLAGGKLRLRIFIDRSTVEVFGGDGRAVISDSVFPRGASKLGFDAAGGDVAMEELKVYRLRVPGT